ncbi:YkyA family protein [Gracilibacillus sp. S3-1-1]|uniref:YkyA family protein n=1 Tax=Gracilibacillus pellucidus TaxID=3095368 RepID=A0ACC6M2B7_9BACI|nr:YkyA family protein [Gracilibacillus sp. S3-1-1]MDX8044877.1 YkyA family protein [Gracilibacillus sp. S3-1-1]
MKRLLLTCLLLSFVLAGCSGDSVANNMYNHLEKTIELEQPFVDGQAPFTALEEQEQDLYDQIINLTADEMDEIQTLADEAISTVAERKELLQTEAEAMEEAEEEFDLVKRFTDDLDDESKSVAEDMVEAMDNRYEAYQQLNEAYLSSLEEDMTLYELFKDEDLTEEDLREQTDQVNAAYDEVLSINTEFNEWTDTYNQLKQDFYDTTELNVVYE